MSQRNYAEAETSFRDLLSSSKKIVGEDHLDTISNLQNLADCLQEQDNLLESEELFRTMVEPSQNNFGREHTDTLIAINGLIEVPIRKGESDSELEPICMEQFALCKKGLGKEHEYTLSVMQNLAWVLRI